MYLNTEEDLNILILGGGDGGVVLQLLKYENIKKITLVDIDEMVVNVSIKYFPQIGKSLLNEKVELVIAEGSEWVFNKSKDEKNMNSFDMMIIDSTEFSKGSLLHTNDFYKNCKKLIKEEGIIVRNVGSPFLSIDMLKNHTVDMKEMFKNVFYYSFAVPSYLGHEYAVAFLSDEVHPMDRIDWDAFEEMDLEYRFYSKGVHYKAFVLSKNIMTELGQKIDLISMVKSMKGGKEE
jgi:spermidine synthase